MTAAARVAALLLAGLGLTPAGRLPAQQWSVEAQAGRIRATLDPSSPAAASFMLGLRYDNGLSGLRLGAGIPTEAGVPVWGSAAAFTRLVGRHRGFVAGVDLAGGGMLMETRAEPLAPVAPGLGAAPRPNGVTGHALAGQLLPVIGFEARQYQIHGRAGVSHYAARFGDERRDRTVRLADVQLTLSPADAVVIMPVVRRFEPDGEAGSTYTGLSAALGGARGSVWGSAGYWLDVDDAAPGWAAGAILRLHPRASLIGNVRRDTFDPLYGNPPQTAWSAGLSIRLGRGRPVPKPPVPASYVQGRATIRLPVSESPAPPGVAGDFNDWTPAPMHRDADQWVHSFAVEPGVYSYAFVTDDGDWFVPETVPGRREDGMGGHVAVLVVE